GVDTGSGDQTYEGTLELAGGNKTLKGATVTFQGNVDGAVDNSGLTVDGWTVLNGSEINTGSGEQRYLDTVNLVGGPKTLNGGTVTFQGNVDGAVDNSGLTVAAATVLNGSEINTGSGEQTYKKALNLVGGPKTLTGGKVTFGGAVDADSGGGGQDLEIEASGGVFFNGAVGSLHRLGTLTLTGPVGGTGELGAETLVLQGDGDVGEANSRLRSRVEHLDLNKKSGDLYVQEFDGLELQGETAGALWLKADGAITQGSPLVVQRIASLQSSTAITLLNGGNIWGNAVELQAAAGRGDYLVGSDSIPTAAYVSAESGLLLLPEPFASEAVSRYALRLELPEAVLEEPVELEEAPPDGDSRLWTRHRDGRALPNAATGVMRSLWRGNPDLN
ncbi:MAG: hypothetical protein H7A47_15530, partial [Verrucomicrobiales bacterium]|nr:hypothetical protein [Verrucomicrobiales bacterium]